MEIHYTGSRKRIGGCAVQLGKPAAMLLHRLLTGFQGHQQLLRAWATRKRCIGRLYITPI